MVIQPTVGRVVLFHPAANDREMVTIGPEPCAALVTRVLSDRRVNVATFDALGQHFARVNVPLVQEGDERPADGGWAEWMPYQVGQARKHAAEDAQKPTA